MRKVIYKEWVPSDYSSTPIKQGYYIEKTGLFHGFFPATVENNQGAFGNYVEAVIEKEDGSVVGVTPSLIRFVDSYESEQLAEFAKAAMQGFISSKVTRGTKELVELSILCAHEIISELKK